MKAQAHAPNSGKSCVPHALAQLTDSDPEVVREFFRQEAERLIRAHSPSCSDFRLEAWDRIFDCDGWVVDLVYDRTILAACGQFAPFGRCDSLAAHLLGPRRLAAIIGERHLSHCNGVEFKPASKVRRLRVKGRGVCRLTTPRLGVGHVVAWENGKVYDPAFVGHVPDGQVDFSIWRRIYSRIGWRLDYITVEV